MGVEQVSVIASALKHMLAAGMPADAIVAAVAAMEAEIAAAPRPRTAGAIRTERWRKNKASLPSQTVTCDASDACDTALVSPNDIISNPLPVTPAANAAAPLSDFSDRVMEDWNREIAGTPLPPAKRMTPARRKALTARVREHGQDAVLIAIRGMTGSDFHSGRSGKWTEGDLGWLLKPENFAKMLERAAKADANKPAPKPSVAGGSLFQQLQDGKISREEFDAQRAAALRAQPPPTHRERSGHGQIAQFIPNYGGKS